MDLPYEMDLLYDVKTSEEMFNQTKDGRICRCRFEDMVGTLLKIKQTKQVNEGGCDDKAG